MILRMLGAFSETTGESLCDSVAAMLSNATAGARQQSDQCNHFPSRLTNLQSVPHGTVKAGIVQEERRLLGTFTNMGNMG